MAEFTHLHLHTQYSILDGATNIKNLFQKAQEYGTKSIAITDHGNMYGVMDFYMKAKENGIKPIIGCETYVAANSRFSKKTKEDRSGFHLILLAKNIEGYQNLIKLVSLAYIEGYYYTPRIDKELLRRYSKNLIALSGCLGGEIPSSILNKDIDYAKNVIKEYHDIFGDDFYLELMRHGLQEQNIVNDALIKIASEMNIPLVATNDVHFINADDYEAHKILICLNTHHELDEATNLIYTGNEYFKSPEEMANLFTDIPEAITNSMIIAEKIEEFELKHDIILPVFPIPDQFKNEFEYLKYLTYEGATAKYPVMTDVIRDRLAMELDVIKLTGYAGYFLIVWDFINKAREMDVIVGPGRGSATGSSVAYCLGITNIDPIKFNLLFERFLNPERISMPDIDIDFDDIGREKVIKYVIEKYGCEKVAQIVTFGSMGARSSIKDVARVLNLSLSESDRLSKLVPDNPVNITLAQAFKDEPKLAYERDHGSDLVKKTLKFASILEGSVRQTGTHACGIVIGPDDLINHVPLCLPKESLLPEQEMMRATQYEGNKLEYIGLLKMDFLGLRTLSIIKKALENIKIRHNIDINLDNISLDDNKIMELFQNADTIGIFQFESEGMRNNLRELKPESFEDIVAMNALYRPGPMNFIPFFIDRKLGRKPVEYPHKLLEDLLKPTYGIMVYQEQIMQAAQILAGFSLGKADVLRKAMGKKDSRVMNEQKTLFIEGAVEKGIDKTKAEEVFNIMKKFAEYGFNRSHSVAYSYLAFQTAFLKAHYPHEYMAAVLTCNLADIKKITVYIEECKRMGIAVLGPDINESELTFTVNSKNEIRFGLGGIKGVGEYAANEVIKERKQNGPFTSIFDFAKRINLKYVNKKCMESFAMAGAFDTFKENHRAQFFYKNNEEDSNFIEKIIKYASNYQNKLNSTQQTLFGDFQQIEMENNPLMPVCEKWSSLEQLKKEKDVIGFYISGHPLDEYYLEMHNFCSVTIEKLKSNFDSFVNREFSFGGIITSSVEKIAKNGNRYGVFTVEDYTDSIQITLWLEDYLKWKHLLETGTFIFIKAKVIIKNFHDNTKKSEIKINYISLLSDVIDKMVKKVILKMPLAELTNNTVSLINNMVKSNPGHVNLSFEIVDHQNGSSLTLSSEHYTVNRDFIKSLKDIPFIQYGLN